MNTKLKSLQSEKTQQIMYYDMENKRRKIFKIKKNKD